MPNFSRRERPRFFCGSGVFCAAPGPKAASSISASDGWGCPRRLGLRLLVLRLRGPRLRRPLGLLRLRRRRPLSGRRPRRLRHRLAVRPERLAKVADRLVAAASGSAAEEFRLHSGAAVGVPRAVLRSAKLASAAGLEAAAGARGCRADWGVGPPAAAPEPIPEIVGVRAASWSGHREKVSAEARRSPPHSWA